MESKQEVFVQSMYGHRTQRGLVMIKIGGFETQITPTKAREVGMMLIDAAESAETDHFMMSYLQEHGGLSRLEAGAILGHFREQRVKMKQADQDWDGQS